MGFAFGSASVVQIIKLLEPIETLLLTVLVNGTTVSKLHGITVSKTLAVLAIVGGTSLLLAKKRDSGSIGQNVNFHSVFFSICSGLAMASRNVVKKMSPTKASLDVKSPRQIHPWKDAATNGLINFFSITFVGAIPATFCLILAELKGSSVITSSGNISSWMLSLPGGDGNQAILFHGLYNISSISVLSLMSAQSHSLLNVGKRIFNVIYASIVFQESISQNGVIGISIAFAGGVIYSCGNNDSYSAMLPLMNIFKQTKTAKSHGRNCYGVCILLLFTVISIYASSTFISSPAYQPSSKIEVRDQATIGTKACFSDFVKGPQ